jgi:ATP-dependent RNA helicase SUPV3L1/SUV3
MSGAGRSSLTAVLGPTNTGKTHLAVSRMCGHSSGMIGFPLRLLAREVYERVVAIKGAAQVALITGEEKILPEGARYFLCTAESMPTDRDVAFVAIDEAQLGADPERGHVFTDRMMNVRGRDETMILGSDTLRPVLRDLLPDAEVIGRPRFSTLSYSAPKKLSRLPKRSAVVAFSADDVYGLAEMIRRQKGGAAVVMGGLSPRTRNAQVELYQSGEVDYLVATDAIGMGLNMDIAHVAFAALHKFDGRRVRRLRPAEMAQIAGRAGRHQSDGTFGSLQMADGEGAMFEAPEIEAIEGHVFEPLQQLIWRNARLNFRSLGSLIDSLGVRPGHERLTRSDDEVDFQVLKRLAHEHWVADRANTPAHLQRLWSACGLPDYRKTGPGQHARLVGRIYRHLTEGSCRIPTDWIAGELARLDDVQGDIPTLADRIAAARTWTFAAHRSDWLADPEHWAGRARELEDRLSDALHQRLTQRFVDRRTSVLMRELSMRGSDLPTEIDADGLVVVGGEEIGRLTGFRFDADPAARAGEKRRLLAAADRRLAGELARRARDLANAPDDALTLEFDGRMPPRILWNGARVAYLSRGRDALSPKLRLDRSLGALDSESKAQARERLEAWLGTMIGKILAPLDALRVEIGEADSKVSQAARGVIVQLIESLGSLTRAAATPLLAHLTGEDRALLARAGVRLGTTHVYIADMLRPEPTRWRLALWAVHRGLDSAPPPPAPGRVSVPVLEGAPREFYDVAGFWPIVTDAVRVDMVERLARAMHKQRQGAAPFRPDATWASSLGLSKKSFVQLMRALGYRAADDAHGSFAWRGLPKPRRTARANAKPSHSPFAVLAHMKKG